MTNLSDASHHALAIDALGTHAERSRKGNLRIIPVMMRDSRSSSFFVLSLFFSLLISWSTVSIFNYTQGLASFPSSKQQDSSFGRKNSVLFFHDSPPLTILPHFHPVCHGNLGARSESVSVFFRDPETRDLSAGSQVPYNCITNTSDRHFFNFMVSGVSSASGRAGCRASWDQRDASVDETRGLILWTAGLTCETKGRFVQRARVLPCLPLP